MCFDCELSNPAGWYCQFVVDNRSGIALLPHDHVFWAGAVCKDSQHILTGGRLKVLVGLFLVL